MDDYLEKLSGDMVKLARLDAYIDELEKIAADAHETGDLEKEAGIQYGLAALKALRGGARALKGSTSIMAGLRSGWGRGMAQAGRVQQTGAELIRAQNIANAARRGVTPLRGRGVSQSSGLVTDLGSPGAKGVSGFLKQQKELLTGVKAYRSGARSGAARNIIRASGARGLKGGETALRTGGVQMPVPGAAPLPTLRGGGVASMESMPKATGGLAFGGKGTGTAVATKGAPGASTIKAPPSSPGTAMVKYQGPGAVIKAPPPPLQTTPLKTAPLKTTGGAAGTTEEIAKKKFKVPVFRAALGAGLGLGTPLAIGGAMSTKPQQPMGPSYAQRYARAGGYR